MAFEIHLLKAFPAAVMVVPLSSTGRAFLEVEAGLGQDGNALLRELAQAVHGLLQEVIHRFVVVEEHHQSKPSTSYHQTQTRTAP
ncbi:MAG: hypothetical protein ACLT98_13455 [Eggerthellaceae bacterium]